MIFGIHGGQVTEIVVFFGYLVWYGILIEAKCEGRRHETWPRLLLIPVIFTLKVAVIFSIFLVIRWLLSGHQYAAAQRERQRQQYQADLYAQAMYNRQRGPYG